ncbi:hypothetical protein TNIN_198761 [Trichonephila inaurata madagascariensis]|uniref:Alpha-carbonic anhydrase domain-containing protein n=1 Tax=Trichonephila inaurata madagascariensis TaxID=2747483 RepID=A0A8X7CUI8_9ARAC|nr:hypothetical protein TNIN_198761 [Trichonephila inaurata madagascariensis]
MADWGYEPHNGPDTWASKYPQAGGQNQSPVDIVTSSVQPRSFDSLFPGNMGRPSARPSSTLDVDGGSTSRDATRISPAGPCLIPTSWSSSTATGGATPLRIRAHHRREIVCGRAPFRPLEQGEVCYLHGCGSITYWPYCDRCLPRGG